MYTKPSYESGPAYLPMAEDVLHRLKLLFGKVLFEYDV